MGLILKKIPADRTKARKVFQQKERRNTCYNIENENQYY